MELSPENHFSFEVLAKVDRATSAMTTEALSGLIALVAVAGTVGVSLAVHLVRRFSVAVLTMHAQRGRA
jgi:hypothetical protein